ncbi:MAG: hypothetical protein IJM62_04810 [Lachnospiraceae bacterium]|nr:hypothetical protein [Lachnospiraceae bacterium]
MPSKNDWILCNNITFTIYNEPDLTAMRREIMELCLVLLKCDAAYSFLNDAGSMLASPLQTGMTDGFLELYRDELFDGDHKKWQFISAKNKQTRSSYLVDESEYLSGPLYKKGYEPLGLYYEAFISASHAGRFLCSVTFLKTKDHGDFTEDDMLFLDIIKSHLAMRLFREFNGVAGAAAASAVTESPAPAKESRPYGLTRRESEIMELLTGDLSTPEICDRLFISMNTLKKHITRIYAKTGVKNRRELIIKIKDQ